MPEIDFFVQHCVLVELKQKSVRANGTFLCGRTNPLLINTSLS